MYIYFRKDNGKFSHVAPYTNGGPWLDEYVNDDKDHMWTYKLVDGVPVKDEQIVETSAPPDETQFNLEALRKYRDSLLAETDWWAVSDRTMTQEQKDYRQALRDITTKYTSIEDAVFPVKPK